MEVIVGVALFTLCALPLIQQPFALAKKSYDRLFEAELYRLAEATRCAILADIQAGTIPWGALPKVLNEVYALPNESCIVDLGEGIKRSFAQKATIQLDKQKKTAEQQEGRLLKLKIHYKPEGNHKEPKGEFIYFFTVIGPQVPGSSS